MVSALLRVAGRESVRKQCVLVSRPLAVAVTHLWVRDSGRGLGRKLVKSAEAFAKVVGMIENAAGSNTRYFMSKQIS
jgi:hypothetical protein